MIKNIIFDFGDIFINLDKPATVRLLSEKFGNFTVTDEMMKINEDYEKGLITSFQFVDYYNSIFPDAQKSELMKAWNAILLDFPEYRLKFIENLASKNKYRLFLLSNTNEIHIHYVKESMTSLRFNRFKKCFEKFYLSYEINLRKPDTEIYKFVLSQNNLKADECLFIDDTPENTLSASQLGIKTWTLIPGEQDIVNIFNQNFNF
ncbi:HAD family hydrolase [Abyssalbus ytuae]|uniref:HAD family phosphatase n=1 Tax=Abyssalbus ytuae TaxID=2926907 RepID=A0A9E7A0W0_9FLAO|nr:HAD family phosphatase [Abyssalbus ytuae]UOB17691.1 HAD family phosphatase [Abyssalbus ytuae]